MLVCRFALLLSAFGLEWKGNSDHLDLVPIGRARIEPH
jgi:hypothetical protein